MSLGVVWKAPRVMCCTVTSGLDSCGTCNADSDGCPKWSWTNGDYRERRE